MQTLNRLGELFEDWKFLFRRDGVGKALPLIAREIAWLPYRRMQFVLLAKPLDEPLPEAVARIPIELRSFEATDVKRVKEINRPSEGKLCAQRLERGQKGVTAVHCGQMIAYAWGCTKLDPDLERVSLQLEEGDVYLTDGYTHPDFRGKGIQVPLLVAFFNTFKSLGFKRAVCYIELKNTPSRAVWKKLNATEIGQIDFTRIGTFYKVNLH